jgi:hypothetical protein
MPEYNLRLQPHAPSEGIAARAIIRGGYTDARHLEIGDAIPQAENATLLLFHGIATWTINSIDNDGFLCCHPTHSAKLLANEWETVVAKPVRPAK